MGLLGKLFGKKSEADTIIDEAKELLKSAPSDPASFHRLAVGLEMKGDFEQAKAACMYGLSADDTYVPIYLQLIQIALQENDWAEAKVSFEKVKELDPNREGLDSLNSLIEFIEPVTEYTIELDGMRKQLANEPKNIRALIHVGCYDDKTDLVERGAKLALERASNDDARDVERAAGYLRSAGKLELAEALYGWLNDRFPEDADHKIELAKVLRLTNRHEEAKALLHQAIALDPSYSRPLYVLGLIEMDANDSEGSNGYFRQGLTLDDGNTFGGEGDIALALVCLASDDLESAYDAIMRAVVSMPKEPHAHTVMGLVLISSDDPDAFKYFLEALYLHPTSLIPMKAIVSIVQSGREGQEMVLKFVKRKPSGPMLDALIEKSDEAGLSGFSAELRGVRRGV